MARHDEQEAIVRVDPADAGLRARIDALLARVDLATGHPPLSDPSLLERSSAVSGLLAFILRDNGSVVGYSHLSHRDGAWTIEIAFDPDMEDPKGAGARLIERSTAFATERGASEIRFWSTQHRGDDSEAKALGFAPERDLLQMRVPLPLAIDHPPIDAGFELRAFRPGHDEEAWLEVNNRAFASHPEQSHWDKTTLLTRERAEWFDPDGFILCERDGRLAASCWTKVHARRDPPLGEIYVISVDPAFQGHGLGRLLAIAGLDWLAGRVDVGMLYVEGDNERALELYRSLGFRVDHIDRCYLLVPGN